VWEWGEGELGRDGGGGGIAGGRWRYQALGCVMGTCMHHMRGGMGSGETYTRPKEYHSGEEEQARHMLFFESGIWECLRREDRCADSRQGAHTRPHR
jgi:hypothetical protein